MMALVLFSRSDDILRVSLNRTPALNAIHRAVLLDLEAGLKEYAGDETIRSLLLFGEGGCFASGADIRELSSLDEKGIREFHRLRERTFSLLESYPCPTIAAIERYALGTGLELALCCDFRVAGADARLGVPSAKLGLVESYEYFNRLVRAVGASWAKKMVFTGEPVDAETAFRIGLVEEVCPPDQVFARAEALLSRTMKNSLGAMRETKKLIAECLADPALSRVDDPALPLVTSTKTEDF
ncbi:MAG TPA: enoyl-CoA hydratase/isomerase family protein, partial [Thermodesulfobacteriota bacterium]|nr:enoyl-CoA hydratase/isomerase family protein [Thermodesulfobacteriota bacterium]